MDFIVPSLTLLAVDSIYLNYIGKNIFGKTVKNIQKSPMQLNFYGAVVSYLLLMVVIYKFIILENKSPNDAFLLGFCIYGIFDFSNYLIFKNYDLFAAITDMVWGGILFYIVTFISQLINKL